MRIKVSWERPADASNIGAYDISVIIDPEEGEDLTDRSSSQIDRLGEGTHTFIDAVPGKHTYSIATRSVNLRGGYSEWDIQPNKTITAPIGQDMIVAPLGDRGWPPDEAGIEGQLWTDGDRYWRKGPDPFEVEVPQDTSISGVHNSGVIFSGGSPFRGSSVVDGQWYGVIFGPESATQEGQLLPNALMDAPPAWLNSIWYKYETTVADVASDRDFQRLQIRISGQGFGGVARAQVKNFVTEIQEDILVAFKHVPSGSTFSIKLDIVGARDFTETYYTPVSLGDRIPLQTFFEQVGAYQGILLRESFRSPADPLNRWVLLPREPSTRQQFDFQRQRGCPSTFAGIRGDYILTEEGLLYEKEDNPWDMNIPQGIGEEGVDGLLRHDSVLLTQPEFPDAPRRTWTFTVDTNETTGLLPISVSQTSPTFVRALRYLEARPPEGNSKEFELDLSSGISVDNVRRDFVPDVEGDIQICLWHRQSNSVAILPPVDKDDTEEPYRWDADGVIIESADVDSLVDFLTTLEGNFDLLILRPSLRCPGDPLNAWVPRGSLILTGRSTTGPVGYNTRFYYDKLGTSVVSGGDYAFFRGGSLLTSSGTAVEGGDWQDILDCDYIEVSSRDQWLFPCPEWADLFGHDRILYEISGTQWAVYDVVRSAAAVNGWRIQVRLLSSADGDFVPVEEGASSTSTVSFQLTTDQRVHPQSMLGNAVYRTSNFTRYHQRDEAQGYFGFHSGPPSHGNLINAFSTAVKSATHLQVNELDDGGEIYSSLPALSVGDFIQVESRTNNVWAAWRLISVDQAVSIFTYGIELWAFRMNRAGTTLFPGDTVNLRTTPLVVEDPEDRLTLELILDPVDDVNEGTTSVQYTGFLTGRVLRTEPTPGVVMDAFIGVGTQFISSSDANIDGYGVSAPVYNAMTGIFTGTVRLPRSVDDTTSVFLQVRARVGRYNRADTQLFRIIESVSDTAVQILPALTGTAVGVRQSIVVARNELHDAAGGWEIRLTKRTHAGNTRAYIRSLAFPRSTSGYEWPGLEVYGPFPPADPQYTVALRQTSNNEDWQNGPWRDVAFNIRLSNTTPPALNVPTFTLTYLNGVFTITPTLEPLATGYDLQYTTVEAEIDDAPIISCPSAATPHTVNQ